MIFQRLAIPACRALRIASFAILMIPPTLFTQSASKPAPAASAAPAVSSLQATASEVSLDLVVRTKGGKPVLDLKASDLAVTDDGQPVKLTHLHLVSQPEESQHLVTFVFDRLDPGAAKAARQIAAKILKVVPASGYSFAVLQINGRLRLIQPYTASRDSIAEVVARITAPDANALPPAGLTPAEKQVMAAAQEDSLAADLQQRAQAKLLLSALESSQRMLEDEQSYPSLTALLALANSQRQITGRKLVIWFAHGMNADSNARDKVHSVVGQANRDGVTIIAIDTSPYNRQVTERMMAAGAMGSAGPGAAIRSANALGASGYSRGQSGPPPIGQVMDAAQNMSSLEFDSMDEYKSPLLKLASGTGGVYMQAGASLKRPLQQLQRDLTTYYEASYVPVIEKYDGAFRPIVVRPLRKGLIIQSRAGYFAVPPDNGSGIRPYEVPLLSILASPNLPTDVPFHAAVLRLGELPDGDTGTLDVEVPVAGLQVREDANTHLSELYVTIVAQIKNEKGVVLDRFSEDIPRHEVPEMLRNPDGQFITMQRHFTAPSGAYTLETAVTDQIGKKSGAARAAFTIPPQPHGPSLSDIALVRSIEPIRADTAPFEPLSYKGGRIVPSLTGELPAGTRSLSLFFMVHPAPALASQPQLSMQIFRGGQPLAKMPLELSKTDGLGAIPYLGTISGSAFPPGRYKVVATLVQEGQAVTSSTEFSVDGRQSALPAAGSAAIFSAAAGVSAGETAAQLAADQQLTAQAALANSKFAVTSPSNPVPAPSESEIRDMTEGARQRALAWSESLPNFFCIEVTDHSVDPSGEGYDWKHKNTVVELMRYANHQESRSVIEVDGKRSTVQPADFDFAHSIGEFGGMLQLVFAPSAHAAFAWKESDVLDGQPVQIYLFKVAQANSNFSLTGENARQFAVPFHGEVWLDTSTRSVRRITITADQIPENLHVKATTISVDYGWVSINSHDYLMPLRGAVSLREGRHEAVLNAFEFHDYRRFGSQIHILSAAESKSLAGDGVSK